MTNLVAEPFAEQPRLFPAVEAVQPPPRTSKQLLFDRNLGCLFWGKLSSMAGTWSFTMIASILVFSETGSALAVGLVGTALYLPQLLLTLPVGTRVDRGTLKGLMVSGAACMLFGTTALATIAATALIAGWAHAIAVMVCSALIGLGIVLSSSPMQAIVPRLVTHEELPTAMGINFAPMTLARIGGPVAGAALVANLGVTAGLLATASCQAIALAALIAVREPHPPSVPEHSDLSMRNAVRHVIADRQLMMMLIVAMSVTFASEPSLTLAAPLAHELNHDGVLIGALTAAFGCGGLAGLLLNRLLDGKGWTGHGISFALSAMTLGMGIAAVSPWAAMALAGFAVAGLGFSIAVSRTAIVIILRVPALLRGRVLSLWMLCFVGVRPAGSAAVGLIADLVSVRAAVAAMAATTLIVLGVLVVRQEGPFLRRRIGQPR